MSQPRPEEPEVVSYRALRIIVGALGALLPVLLVVSGKLLEQPVLLPALSDYYAVRPPGDLFVGVLFAISSFLFAYGGYDLSDRIVGKTASLSALGVALCPVNGSTVIHAFHLVFAGLFFLMLAVFSFLFTQTHEDGQLTRSKEERNLAYRLSGGTISLCLLAIGVLKFTGTQADLAGLPVILVLESVALFAFSAAWFIKGEIVLADRRGELRRAPGGPRVYEDGAPRLAK
jgi:hypothetical protein